MALSKETIRERVRAIIGNPTTDDIIDDTIDWFIDVSVMEIAEKSEGENATVGTLTTVADQQNYAPADGAGEIVDVYWRGDVNASSIYSDVYTDAASYLTGVSQPIGDIGWHQRAIDLIQEMKADRWYNISSRGYNWDYLSGEIWLDPPPSESGLTVYYLYTTTTNLLASIGDEKERGIVYFAAWQSLLTVANSRAGAGVVFRETIEGQKAVVDLIQNAERYKEMWDDFVLDMMGGRF